MKRRFSGIVLISYCALNLEVKICYYKPKMYFIYLDRLQDLL